MAAVNIKSDFLPKLPLGRSNTDVTTETTINNMMMMIDDDDDGNGDNDYDDENEEGRNYYRDKMTSDNGKAVGKFQERSQKEVEIPPTSTFALPNRFAENQSTRKSKFRATMITAIEEQEAYYTKLEEKYEESSKNNDRLSEQLNEQSKSLNDTQSVLAATQQRERELSETTSNLSTTIKSLESRLNELPEAKRELKTARRQRTLANGKLKKMREEKKMLNDRYEEAMDELTASQHECSRLGDVLAETERKGETTEFNLAATTSAYEKALEDLHKLEYEARDSETANIHLLSRMTQFAKRIAALEKENHELVVSANDATAKAQLAAKKANSALEAVVLDRQKLQNDIRASVVEREGLGQHIEALEGKGLADEMKINMYCAELAVAKAKIAALSDVEAELRAAQQQVEKMNEHINACPICSRPPEFWDDWEKGLETVASISRTYPRETNPSEQHPAS